MKKKNLQAKEDESGIYKSNIIMNNPNGENSSVIMSLDKACIAKNIPVNDSLMLSLNSLMHTSLNQGDDFF